MKNYITIDLDTERDNPIIFGKPSDMVAPSNKTEAKAMILADIAMITDALKTLILMAHENDYGNKSELISLSISSIYEINKENTEIEEKDSK